MELYNGQSKFITVSNPSRPALNLKIAISQIIELYNKGLFEEVVSLTEKLDHQYPNMLIIKIGITWTLIATLNWENRKRPAGNSTFSCGDTFIASSLGESANAYYLRSTCRADFCRPLKSGTSFHHIASSSVTSEHPKRQIWTGISRNRGSQLSDRNVRRYSVKAGSFVQRTVVKERDGPGCLAKWCLFWLGKF